MEPRAVESYLPQVAALIEGKASAQTEEKPKKYFALSGGGYAPQTDRYGYITTGAAYTQAPEGSVALIPVIGPIMKNDYCGSIGTASMRALIKEAEANPNIIGIVLNIDSPGGSVDGTEVCANMIKNCSKPTVGFVDDMAASAAMWLASSCNEIFASTSNDTVGSIGTMSSLYDYRKRMEQLGIKLHEIYATESVHKNKDHKDALDGNYTSIITHLDSINETFTTAIKNNRAGKYDLEKENILTGKTYLAKDAVTNGLIDAIGSLDQAVARAKELAEERKKSNQITNPKTETMKFKSGWKAIGAYLASAFKTEAKDGETDITAEHLESINTQLADYEALRTSAAADKDLLTAAQADVTKLTEEKAALETEKANLEARVAELEKGPAVQAAAPGAKKDPAPASSIIDPNAEHNKLASEVAGK